MIRKFTTKDNREAILRTPKWEDLDGFLELINSLVEEEADIYIDKKLSRDEEADWMGRMLSNIEKNMLRSIVAEVNGKVVGHADVGCGRYRQRHVGSVGIIVREGFRDIGIGSEMLKEIEVEAKKLGLEILTIDVFSSNSRAHHVYEKAGYRETGRIPKAVMKGEARIDLINMFKEI